MNSKTVTGAICHSVTKEMSGFLADMNIFDNNGDTFHYILFYSQFSGYRHGTFEISDYSSSLLFFFFNLKSKKN